MLDRRAAIDDYNSARMRANLEEILELVTNKPRDLLSYEEVRHRLRLTENPTAHLEEIPLDAIVGSVDRYTDFTRRFLPRAAVTRERWVGVQIATNGLVGLPPIEVYRIGGVYFVKDGNHRVSVARSLGARFIEAYVTELRVPVTLAPDITADQLVLKAEEAEFLDQTNLRTLLPDARLEITVPGQYHLLEEHIRVHRYFMGLDQRRQVTYEEALRDWYQNVYRPVADAIVSLGLLRHFPGRTETDLYLWISEHQWALRESLGWDIPAGAAAEDWLRAAGGGQEPLWTRVGGRFFETIIPESLAAGPAPGYWREQRLSDEDCLFANILVPLNGSEAGWQALDQAMRITCAEDARLLGLYIVPSSQDVVSDKTDEVRDQFLLRCAETGVRGQFAVETGTVARKICERARFADLVVAALSHPPGGASLSRLRSGFRMLIRRCATPVLAVPDAPSSLDRPLLAFDGSPKAREALYVAAHLAARMSAPLVVVTVIGGGVTRQIADEAAEYLRAHGVAATQIVDSGNVPEVILRTAQAHERNLLILGGYGYGPVTEVVLGSAIDRVLRESRQPVLICR